MGCLVYGSGNDKNTNIVMPSVIVVYGPRVKRHATRYTCEQLRVPIITKLCVWILLETLVQFKEVLENELSNNCKKTSYI